jgi:hypothetical protein
MGQPEKTRVVNYRKENYDVLIMRPSIWSNPYRIGVDGTREEVLEKFRRRLTEQPFLVQLARERLKGKVLGCCCKPLACHGDIWVEFIEGD